MQVEQTMNMLISGAPTGLGDRFLCFASGMRLSNKLSRRFGLWWPMTEHCMARFNDLFDPINGLNIIEESKEELLGRKDLHYYNYTEGIDIDPLYGLPTACSYIDTSKKNIFVRSPSIEILPEEKGSMSSKIFRHNLENEIRFYFRQLRPKKEIMAIIEDFSKEFDDNTISIHIRRTDSPSWIDGRLPGNKQLIRILTNQLNERPQAKIFVATDSTELQAILKNSFQEKIITYPHKTWADKITADQGWSNNIVRSKESIVDALIEINLLSRTKTFLRFKTYSGRMNIVASYLNPHQKIIYISKSMTTLCNDARRQADLMLGKFGIILRRSIPTLYYHLHKIPFSKIVRQKNRDT